MKKVSFILAAAAMAFAMTACTDEPIIPEIIEDGTEINVEPRVKSASDLMGTEWSYAMEDLYLVDENGDTVDAIILSDMQFTLTFNDEYAQLAFPEDMVMLTTTYENDEYTIEEVQGMHFDYTYDLPTTSGMLTATDNDITGEPINMQIPFDYDAAADAIIINLPIEYDENGAVQNSIQLVFNRN